MPQRAPVQDGPGSAATAETPVLHMKTKLTFRPILIYIIAEFNFLPIYKKTYTHINSLYFSTISHIMSACCSVRP